MKKYDRLRLISLHGHTPPHDHRRERETLNVTWIAHDRSDELDGRSPTLTATAQGASGCAHAARNESRDSRQNRGSAPSLSDGGRTRYTLRDGYRANNTVSRA